MLEIILLLGVFGSLSLEQHIKLMWVESCWLDRNKEVFLSCFFLVYLQGWEIKLAQGSWPEVQSVDSSLQTPASDSGPGAF